MTIESKIDELIAALDRNTTAQGSPVIATKATSPKAVKAVKPKTEDEAIAQVIEITQEQVKAALDSLLKANKRKEAIDLFKSFNGATNVTGVVAEGQEAMASFIEKANEILLTA